MNRTIAKAVVAVLAVSALTAIVVAALLVWVVPYGQFTLVIDGERIDIPELTAGHWLAATLALWIALIVAIVVLPFVLVLAVGLPLLVAGIVTAAVLSPLLLIGLLVWWLWRRDRATMGR